MSKVITFVSTCPACGHQRLQDGYTRRALIRLLAMSHTIDAYCITCDVLWPISAQERVVMARAIAADYPDLVERSLTTAGHPPYRPSW